MSNPRPLDVLGVTSSSGGFHDSSVVWVRDGKIQFALSEERLSRIKHDHAFPTQALRETLRYSGLQPADFAGIGVGWMSYRPMSGFFGRSLFDVPQTVLRSLIFQPKLMLGYTSKNFLRKKVIPHRDMLEAHGFQPGQISLFSHHLAHAASSFRTSGYDEALSVNLDCFGPDDRGNLWSGAAFIARRNHLHLIEYVPAFASLGLFYSALSVCLGFKFGDGEGKTMGLAAYGNPSRVYHELNSISPHFQNGVWRGHASWSDFRLIDQPALLFTTKWGRFLRDLIARTSREDVAAAAQQILEQELMNYLSYLLLKTGQRKIALAGGIFLNVTFNRKLAERAEVEQVFVHPFPSDGGTAAGAALELSARLSDHSVNYQMTNAALGSEFNEAEILAALDGASGIAYSKPADLPMEVAKRISEGAIVGWFQGRSEWGPRALGQRSVLGDPRAEGTKERLNRLLKSRDWFMPFAPSILEECASDYFENSFFTPFMTFSFRVRPEKVNIVPEIVHADGTARPNMVRYSENALYHRLISCFREITGIPIVLNTSFNRHGLPLVNTPNQAIDHLRWGCVDELALGDYLVRRVSEVQDVDDFAKKAQIDAYTDGTAHEQAIQPR